MLHSLVKTLVWRLARLRKCDDLVYFIFFCSLEFYISIAATPKHWSKNFHVIFFHVWIFLSGILSWLFLSLLNFN
jgi:hypothetical protein